MTDTTNNQPDRLDRIEALVISNTQAIASVTARIDQLALKVINLTDNVDQLTSNVDRVLARSAVLDDVLLELRDSHELHQRNFEEHQRNFIEHQRTTNAALNSLEAILLRLITNFP